MSLALALAASADHSMGGVTAANEARFDPAPQPETKLGTDTAPEARLTTGDTAPRRYDETGLVKAAG